jgi:hypothetical protein
LLGIIESRSIWASNARYLNDSAEVEAALEMIHQQAEKRKPPSWQRELLQNSIDSIRSVERTVFVTSFSASKDSLSQWRGYCPVNAGYAIGFDTMSLTECGRELGFHFVPCIYDPTVQKKVVNRAIEATLQLLERSENANRFKAAVGRMTAFERLVVRVRFDYDIEEELTKGGVTELLGILKAPAFHEEREWRLVGTMNDDEVRGRLRFRQGASMLIPFLSVELAPTMALLPIREVWIGPTPHPDLARSALEGLLASKGFEHVTVHNSDAPFRSW